MFEVVTEGREKGRKGRTKRGRGSEIPREVWRLLLQKQQEESLKKMSIFGR